VRFAPRWIETNETTGESKERYGESENDPDATGESARGRLRGQQQGRQRFLEELAKLAIGEVKKNGVFVLPRHRPVGCA